MHSNLETVMQQAIEAASANPTTSVRKTAVPLPTAYDGISKSEARATQQLLAPEQEEKRILAL